MQSVFTQAIVDGLRSGDADRDKDGLITVTDIYHHVYERVRAAEPRQTPELWTYGAEGDVLLAYSVRGAVIEPVPLPEDLRVTLESPRPRVRETAVAELAELLDAARPGLVLSARQALQQISDEDIPRVAAVAGVALEAPEGMAAREVSRELAQRNQREQARREAEEAARQQAEERARREAEEAARQLQAAPVRDEVGGNPVPPRRQRRRWYPGVAVAAGVVLALAGVAAAILVIPASYGSPPAGTHSTGSGAANRPTSASTLARLTLAARLADPGGKGVVSAGFAPGSEIAAIDANGSTYLWDIATGHVAAPLPDPGHQSIATASFDRGGRFAVMAGHTGDTYVLDIATRHRIGALPGLNTLFLISPEGDTVISVDANRDGIALTDSTQGNPHTFTDPDHVDLTAGAALSPADGSTLAVNDASGRTYLRDTAAPTPTMIATWTSPGGVANLAVFSPDGKTLADTAGAGKVYLWDIPSHRLAGTVPIPAGTSLDGMAISPDGKLLAGVSRTSDKVYLWDLSTGQQVDVITDPGGKGTASAAFNPDGKTLAIGDSDGSTYLWNIQRE